MKIGVSTLALAEHSISEILEYLEDIGADYCEIINEYPMADVEVTDSYSIGFTVHAPISDINIASLNDRVRDASVREVMGSVDLAADIGADVLVVHPGLVPFLGRRYTGRIMERNLESLREIVDYGEERGVGVFPENMPRLEGPLMRDLDELWGAVEELDTMATLDVAHAATMGYGVDEMVTGRVGHVHLSDNDRETDSHDALGEGSIDFRGLLDKLEDHGYRGVLTVEVKNTREIESSVEFLRRIIH
ncbi:MAG TPA: sugar phosphate isomerase/epimerase [Methanothermobacter thermautotrophicus]|uniref:Sugar phosphate isomerase/epimerase n=1 Tax=Methanothermobacter thermautotrophicus TaxID=145262 RepID=A0A7J4MTV6_METTF|nr:sugar phosphate isomerase/epimerase [Methanothermobacter thermautotrophicus]